MDKVAEVPASHATQGMPLGCVCQIDRFHAKVPDEGVEVTKLFDVLAESPKGIVARLLFELGGDRQALSLSEVMHVDLVEVPTDTKVA
eukprot:5931475-Amphidinium_carterae.1